MLPRDRMRSFRALALLVAGAIAAFTVTAHPDFLNMPLVGVIVLVMVLGALWLGLRHERIIRVIEQLVAFLSSLDRPAGKRVPLQELLRPNRGPSGGGES
jgi:hypothetical protein